MESKRTLEIADLPIFTTEVSNTEQKSLLGGADYYIDKDKYDCYSYYNQKWGGTYYKCYQDKYTEQIPPSEIGKGSRLP